MASVVVVTAGAALAASVPFVALKESFEQRLKSNMKKHLGQRPRCRVNFPDIEDELEQQYQYLMMKKNEKDQKVVSINPANKCSSDDEDNSSTISSPPSYNDITQPPAYGLFVPRGNWTNPTTQKIRKSGRGFRSSCFSSTTSDAIILAFVFPLSLPFFLVSFFAVDQKNWTVFFHDYIWLGTPLSLFEKNKPYFMCNYFFFANFFGLTF